MCASIILCLFPQVVAERDGLVRKITLLGADLEQAEDQLATLRKVKDEKSEILEETER